MSEYTGYSITTLIVLTNKQVWYIIKTSGGYVMEKLKKILAIVADITSIASFILALMLLFIK